MCASWRPWWCQSHGCDPDGEAAWSRRTILRSGTAAGPYHSLSSVGSCEHTEEDIYSLLHYSGHSFLNSLLKHGSRNSLDTLLLSLLQLSISSQHSPDGFLLVLRQKTQVNHDDCMCLVVEHDHRFIQYFLRLPKVLFCQWVTLAGWYVLYPHQMMILRLWLKNSFFHLLLLVIDIFSFSWQWFLQPCLILSDNFEPERK